MKKLLLLAILCSTSYALQAPYLYTADSVADTAIQLTWRNNSAAYLGIIILRATTTAGQYGVIDTAPGTATSFTDIVKPTSRTTYYYALTAYSQTEHADTSNVDTASITPNPVPFDTILKPPLQLFTTWDTSTHACYVGFYDSSKVETGYRVYRSTNFGPFQMVKDIPSAIPTQEGYVTDTDATVSPNTWNVYTVQTYKGLQFLSSDTDTVFTFDVNAMKRNSPKKLSVLNKIGSFPIKYGTWSLKSGDTIVLNELNAPDSSFSIIDVSTPSQPRFAGMGKSGAAAIFHYPSPSSQVLSAYTKGDYVFRPTGDSLSCCRYQSGTVQAQSTINLAGTALTPCGFFSDSLLIVPTLTGTSPSGKAPGLFYFQANEVLFKNNTLSYSKQELLRDYYCGGMLGGNCDYSTSPTLASGVVYQGRLFAGIPGYGGSIQNIEVIDFNYPVPPRIIFNMYWLSLAFFDIQLLGNGISLDAPALEADSSWIRSNSHAILVDTVKNLVFALSDSELSVYNCNIVTGVSRAFPSPHAAQTFHVGREANGFASLIFLPHHVQPADVSIYDMSGKRIVRMEGVQGETVAWPQQNRAGVYVVRAMLDGCAITAKVAVTK